jgi:LuxR family maltose regulon positive regulatory protein
MTMPRRANRTTPLVVSGRLYTDDAATGTTLGSPAWFAWLTTATAFYFESPLGTFTAHREQRQRGGWYWIAYRRRNGRLQRVHLGKPDQLTVQRLTDAALTLSRDLTDQL